MVMTRLLFAMGASLGVHYFAMEVDMQKVHSLFLCFACTLFIQLSSPLLALDQLHYDLSIKCVPEEHRISAEAIILFPHGAPKYFLLHQGFRVTSPIEGIRFTRLAEIPKAHYFGCTEERFPFDEMSAVNLYKVSAPKGTKQLIIRYGGVIYHRLKMVGQEYARDFQSTVGTIGDEGIYLSTSSAFYPWFGRPLFTFRIRPYLPSGWSSISQGTEKSGDWHCLKPQDDIYFVAAPFVKYGRTEGKVKVAAYLRQKDDGLAEKYLAVTSQYIKMYSELIGPYPYSKFALVENFWETGYGMPSFTLLGPKVIRFPFILHSSYPHEILHNWWGNSVYVDYSRGNWCEGLTAYLADHLIKEQRGQGAEYRLGVLQKYRDFVAQEKDFPLTQFRSRHSSASEAVGYGKALMVFHMLRKKLGDEKFVEAIRDFYKRCRFRMASWKDVENAFSKVTEEPLSSFFKRWTESLGGPSLHLGKVSLKGKELNLALEQRQQAPPFPIEVPIVVTLKSGRPFQTTIQMEKRHVEKRIELPEEGKRLDVDPKFDLFRLPHAAETPPALSALFGAQKILFVLPHKGKREFIDAYRQLAKVFSQGKNGTIQFDNEIKALPADCALWFFGFENEYLSFLKTHWQKYNVNKSDLICQMGENKVPLKNHSFVLAHRSGPQAIGFLSTQNAKALPPLTRKLPHYHKYSYLAFEGDEAENVSKGRWSILASPLSRTLIEGDGERTNTKEASPLATLPPLFSQRAMERTITTLSANEFGGRGLGTKGLEKAANYIVSTFRRIGLKPVGDNRGSYFQKWRTQTGSHKREMELTNIVAQLSGTNSDMAKEYIVVGAHYDHLGKGWPDVRKGNEGKIHPGADDNASGIAVLLEVAKILAQSGKRQRNIIFCAFTGEEDELRGSSYFVKNPPLPLDGCLAMVNLDTVGRLFQKKLLVLGTSTAREWVHIFRGVGYVTGVPIQTVREDPGSSDQMSFINKGVPAIQLFTGGHQDYHRPSDTFEKIDGPGLVKVATVLFETIDYLTSRREKLNGPHMGDHGSHHQPSRAPGGERKVLLGTVPDFTFSGKGVRVDSVIPQSPVQKCGIQKGDIITKVASSTVTNLREYSAVLKKLEPDQKVTITYTRNEKTETTEVTLVAR